MEAYAAYHKRHDWIPLSSICNEPLDVEHWISATYVNGNARAEFKVVKIRIKVVSQ